MDQDLLLGNFGNELTIVGCTVSGYNARTPICANCHSLNDLLFLYGEKQMRSRFFEIYLMMCTVRVRQCVLQSFLIQDTAPHKNITIQLQLILKKLTCSSLQRT